MGFEMTKPLSHSQQFFLTAPSPCPYLPDRDERKVFTHLAGPQASALNTILSQGGFRRSQAIAYRPACETCASCISVRVCTNEFTPTRSMNRIRGINDDLISRWRRAEATSDQYSLFRRYLDSRHSDGGMASMTVLDYAVMVEDNHVESGIVEYRRRAIDSDLTDKSDSALVACSLTDVLGDGLSMVYSFFEPDEARRSLGTMMILDHIERARRLGKRYLYLGYWIDGSPKMDYKARFKPQQRLGPQGWITVR